MSSETQDKILVMILYRNQKEMCMLPINILITGLGHRKEVYKIKETPHQEKQIFPVAPCLALETHST